MRIASSQMTLTAASQKTVKDVRTERLQAWVDPPSRPTPVPAPLPPPLPTSTSTSTSTSAPATASATPPGHGCGARDAGPDPALDRDALDLLILIKMLEREDKNHGLRDAARALAGADDVRGAYAATAQPNIPAAGPNGTAAPPAPPPAPHAGWGLSYDRHEEHTETQRTAFSAQGTVTTADGRSIAIDASLAMERTESRTRDVHVRAGDAKRIDPLVVNAPGQAATFDGRQTFDLDADGSAESIARLAGDSAYLAVDANNNGRIDDGRELFGPTTGDGFAELARADGDGNGWIDENDAIWSQLRLWRPGEGENPGSMATLRAAGVGAIYTGSVATPFRIAAPPAATGAAERAVATVAQTGVYLSENGTPGTIQHVDLLV